MKEIAILLKDRVSSLFSRQVDSIVVVDTTSNLKLIDVELKGEIRINALKIVEFGNAKREDLIASSLQDFLKKNNIQRKNAILLPLLSQLYVKRIQLPAVSEAELIEAAKWQLKNDIPFDLSKAVFDYQIIKKNALTDGSKNFDILCIVAEEAEVKKQVLLLKQAGLVCLAVNLPVFGYAKLIEKYLGETKDKPVAIVHIAENNSCVAIYKENMISFFRKLPIAIDKLRESLSAELVTEKGRVQLTADEINDCLFHHGIPLDGSLLYKDKMSSGQILAMLRPSLEMLSQEIKRSLEYYNSQFQGTVPKNLLLCAEAVKIPGLDKFLTSELSMECSIPQFSDKIKISSAINPLDLTQSYAGVGAAINYEKNINLLPREFRTEKIERFQKVSLRWVTFVAFLLLVVSYLLGIAAVSAYQKRLDNASFELNVLSEIRQTREKIDAFDNFAAEIKKSEFPLTVILKKISSLAPNELFLKKLTFDCEGKKGIIFGYIKSAKSEPETLLAKFIGAMNNTGHFKDIDIDLAKKILLQGFEVVSFEVNFKLQ